MLKADSFSIMSPLPFGAGFFHAKKGLEDMEHPDVVFADPWLKKTQENARMPEGVQLACTYQVYEVIEWFYETAFFYRTETTDDLWIKGYRTGRVLAVPRDGEVLPACLKLMHRYLRAKVGFQWPCEFATAGIVGKSNFDSLVGRIERELEENTRKARETETEIITVARELGLCPEPTGKGPSYWYARCPGRNHVLFINASEDSFGCGWCERKGGTEELQTLVRERKQMENLSLEEEKHDTR